MMSSNTTEKKKHAFKKIGNDGFLNRRKKLLVEFFSALGINIRLVGDPKYPNFIRNNKEKFPISIEGDDLILRDGFHDDAKVVKIHLKEYRDDKDTRGKLKRSLIKDQDYINSMSIAVGEMETKKVYILKYNGLYLHDLKYVEPNSSNNKKFPVFAARDPKVIYTEEHAVETARVIQQEHGLLLELE